MHRTPKEPAAGPAISVTVTEFNRLIDFYEPLGYYSVVIGIRESLH